MSVSLPELPYATNALEPFLSAKTLETHHGKHHQGYVDKLNKLIEGTDYAGRALEDMIIRARAAGDIAIFNNAAQVLNHNFLWDSMSPDGGGAPEGRLGDAIDAAFGGLSGFHKAFKDAATGQFGSGWVWLVSRPGKLEVVSTGNADTPILHDATPLLTLDVWEHAYYLDYKNERARYVDAFLSDCANWSFAASNLEAIELAA